MAQPRVLNNKLQTRRAALEALGIYNGEISAAGAISNAPAGWTGGAPAASVFTVTHNLGLAANSYQVITTPNGVKGSINVLTRGANSFTVETWDLATPTKADLAFMFQLIRGDAS